jgi:hypothetical protein
VLVGAPDGVREVVCIANDTHSLVGIVKELGNSNADVLALLSSGLKTGSDGHRLAVEILPQWYPSQSKERGHDIGMTTLDFHRGILLHTGPHMKKAIFTSPSMPQL